MGFVGVFNGIKFSESGGGLPPPLIYIESRGGSKPPPYPINCILFV